MAVTYSRISTYLSFSKFLAIAKLFTRLECKINKNYWTINSSLYEEGGYFPHFTSLIESSTELIFLHSFSIIQQTNLKDKWNASECLIIYWNHFKHDQRSEHNSAQDWMIR